VRRTSDVTIEQLLQVLLLATLHHRLLGLLRILLDLLEAGLAAGNLLGERVLFPGAVPRVDGLLHDALLQQLGNAPQAASEAVHAADVCDEHVLDVGALAAELAVEVVASRGDAPARRR